MALLDKLFSRTTLSEESGEAEKKRKAAADAAYKPAGIDITAMAQADADKKLGPMKSVGGIPSITQPVKKVPGNKSAQ